MSMKVYDITRKDEVTKETKGYEVYKVKAKNIKASKDLKKKTK